VWGMFSTVKSEAHAGPAAVAVEEP
jgi:hypothetical protein